MSVCKENRKWEKTHRIIQLASMLLRAADFCSRFKIIGLPRVYRQKLSFFLLLLILTQYSCSFLSSFPRAFLGSGYLLYAQSPTPSPSTALSLTQADAFFLSSTANQTDHTNTEPTPSSLHYPTGCYETSCALFLPSQLALTLFHFIRSARKGDVESPA